MPTFKNVSGSKLRVQGLSYDDKFVDAGDELVVDGHLVANEADDAYVVEVPTRTFDPVSKSWKDASVKSAFAKANWEQVTKQAQTSKKNEEK